MSLNSRNRSKLEPKDWNQFYPDISIIKSASIPTLVSYILNLPTATTVEEAGTIVYLADGLNRRLMVRCKVCDKDSNSQLASNGENIYIDVSVGKIFDSYPSINPLEINRHLIDRYEHGSDSIFNTAIERLLSTKDSNQEVLLSSLSMVYLYYGAATVKAVLFPHSGKRETYSLSYILDTLDALKDSVPEFCIII